MPGNHVHYQHKRSFFWPVILIGAGVTLLLANLNIIPTENLWILLRLWPVLIIVAGLDVLFARRLPMVGALLALLVIAGVVYILLFGVELGLEGAPEPQTQSYVVPVSNTTLAKVELNLSVQDTKLTPLPDSVNLIEAEIAYLGEIEFAVTGVEEKQIRLEPKGIMTWFSWLMPDDQDRTLDWAIGLSTAVPIDLVIDTSTGRSDIDLRGLRLERLYFDGGTGTSKIFLPASMERYQARLEASTGSLDVVFPAESNMTVQLRGSTGRILLDIPVDAAVQIEVLRGGTGDLFIPDWINRVSGREGRDEGIYQTEGFEEAVHQLIIIVERIGMGHIVVE